MMKLTIQPTGSTVNAEHEGVCFPLSMWQGTTEDGVAVVVAVGFIQVAPESSSYMKIKLSRFKEQKIRSEFQSLDARNLKKP